MYCKINGLEIYFEEIGSGKPVLMIHGFGIDHYSVKICMEEVFQDRTGYKRIYFDLPGMGKTKSAPSVKSSDDMLDVVEQFLKLKIPSEKFLLVGLSYGAYLARALCKSHRSRILGLCMVVPLIVPEMKNRDLPKKQIIKEDPTLEKVLTAEELTTFKNMAVLATKEIWERTQREIAPALALADQTFLDRIFNNHYALSWDVDAVEKPYEFPTLILTGKFDDSVGYQDAWGILKNFNRATFAVLDEAGHMLEMEKERLFGELVVDWVERCS